MKNTDSNFNEEVSKAFKGYREKGGELIIKVKQTKFEMLMIAAVEGARRFREMAKQCTMESVAEAATDIIYMAWELKKISENSTVILKFKKDENNDN